MERVGNAAIPATAATVVVPDSVPLPGLVPMAMVMLAVEPVTVLSKASRTVTRTGGAIAAPAVVTFAGCTVMASLGAPAGLMSKAADVAPVSGADTAVSV